MGLLLKLINIGFLVHSHEIWFIVGCEPRQTNWIVEKHLYEWDLKSGKDNVG